jgi:formate hydrogenlyase transcriptional activator
MACATVGFEDQGMPTETRSPDFSRFDGEQQLHIGPTLSSDHCGLEGVIGRSPAIQRVLKQVQIVAPTAATVLLHGETGTGKELIAQAIHNLSSRRERPYVRMNCAAIPSGLLESELFGHEKGAFTGALIQRKGRFELADGGSLFLDEIGDISLELQPKLLRAVQDRSSKGSETRGRSRSTCVSLPRPIATFRPWFATKHSVRIFSIDSTSFRLRFRLCESGARTFRCS